MSLIKQSMLAAVLAVSAVASAVAAPITIGGVTFDPESAFDFSAQSNINLSNLDGNVITGIGRVTAINNTYNFCPSCEVTFAFGYDLLAFGNLDSDVNGINEAVFENGYVNFYVDTANNFDGINVSTATDGIEWLTLVGHEGTGIGGVGTLFATLLDGGTFDGTAAGSSNGMLDVFGGLAGAYFDTNAGTDGSDMTFSSSFQPSNASTGFQFIGTAEFSGDTQAVPEPLPLALMGLGLLGLAFTQRKREKAIV